MNINPFNKRESQKPTMGMINELKELYKGCYRSCTSKQERNCSPCAKCGVITLNEKTKSGKVISENYQIQIRETLCQHCWDKDQKNN